MWSRFKSWWYWNISTKYDALDLFVYTYFPFVVFLMVLAMYNSYEHRKEFLAYCESKNGVVVKGVDKQYHCMSKEAVK